MQVFREGILSRASLVKCGPGKGRHCLKSFCFSILVPFTTQEHSLDSFWTTSSQVRQRGQSDRAAWAVFSSSFFPHSLSRLCGTRQGGWGTGMDEGSNHKHILYITLHLDPVTGGSCSWAWASSSGAPPKWPSPRDWSRSTLTPLEPRQDTAHQWLPAYAHVEKEE